MTGAAVRILVTDDDPLGLNAAYRLLNTAGYEVITAINGEQTLRLAEKHRPDLILLDVDLPDILGTEICRRLKVDARTAGSFVILLSGTHISSDQQSQGMEGGADGYIIRPVASRELLARVQAFLRIKSVELSLRESEARFRLMADTAPALIWISGADTLCTYFNKTWLDFTGRTLEQELGNGWTEGLHPDDYQECLDTYLSAFNSQREFKMEYRLRRVDASFSWLLDYGVPRFDAEGSFLGYIGSCVDITEHKLLEEELRSMQDSLKAVNSDLQSALVRETQLARTDVLTGINNRRHLYELAEHEFSIARRYGQPLSVIMFDIDHFKQVNDTFGHEVGDLVLQRVAQVVCAEMRTTDFIGRYGGEEFVIVLPVTNTQQAYPLAERIRAAVEALRIPTRKGIVNITISIGIDEILHSGSGHQFKSLPGAEESGPVELVDDVFRRADEALYVAKSAGRNLVRVYQPSL